MKIKKIVSNGPSSLTFNQSIIIGCFAIPNAHSSDLHNLAATPKWNVQPTQSILIGYWYWVRAGKSLVIALSSVTMFESITMTHRQLATKYGVTATMRENFSVRCCCCRWSWRRVHIVSVFFAANSSVVFNRHCFNCKMVRIVERVHTRSIGNVYGIFAQVALHSATMTPSYNRHSFGLSHPNAWGSLVVGAANHTHTLPPSVQRVVFIRIKGHSINFIVTRNAMPYTQYSLP